ncbi:MAG: mycofactocin-coupled SDR family oxidoreductase [Pseudonocardia sp.]|nr:mycofactocin-coupled SDR family oxidoreductase [Pseudonocardia sp.]
MGHLDGKIAFITGAARGQGRAHALLLAEEGADIIATDIAAPVDTVRYPASTPEDLAETVKSVEALDRRIYSFVADVRDYNSLQAGLADGVAELGGLDIVVANAGICNDIAPSWEIGESDWQATLDVNLTGVWHTAKAAAKHLMDRGPGGSLILISSTSGFRGIPNLAPYNAAKHGVLGLAKTLANELAPYRIRVNSIHPATVHTIMIDNESTARVFRPDLDNPTLDDSLDALRKVNLWDTPYVQVEDIANAALFLASDNSRYITGAALPVDLGMKEKYSGL